MVTQFQNFDNFLKHFWHFEPVLSSATSVIYRSRLPPRGSLTFCTVSCDLLNNYVSPPHIFTFSKHISQVIELKIGIGLFVLLLMHSLRWFQIWSPNFNMLQYLNHFWHFWPVNIGSTFGKCMGQFSFSQRHIPAKKYLEYRLPGRDTTIAASILVASQGGY